jgi:hypothetical protein
MTTRMFMSGCYSRSEPLGCPATTKDLTKSLEPIAGRRTENLKDEVKAKLALARRG